VAQLLENAGVRDELIAHIDELWQRVTVAPRKRKSEVRSQRSVGGGRKSDL
jgi:hypothetical protein